MSQLPRLARARQLTASVLPGRVVDGYGNLITSRLRKLAAAKSTGTLPFSGRSEGAIYFEDGKVSYAESGRIPGPAAADGPGSAAYLLGPAAADAAIPPPFARLAAILAVAEPTVDAALELLSSESRYAKFRPSKVPARGLTPSIPLEGLLAEVARRQRVLKQLSAFVTPDTAVARNPQMHAQSVRVSALQWALLIRVSHGSTPRGLAWDLSRSVFGTTAEIYRLLTLRLLTAADHSANGAGALSELPERGPAILSFVRAASDKKGYRMPDRLPAGRVLGIDA